MSSSKTGNSRSTLSEFLRLRAALCCFFLDWAQSKISVSSAFARRIGAVRLRPIYGPVVPADDAPELVFEKLACCAASCLAAADLLTAEDEAAFPAPTPSFPTPGLSFAEQTVFLFGGPGDAGVPVFSLQARSVMEADLLQDGGIVLALRESGMKTSSVILDCSVAAQTHFSQADALSSLERFERQLHSGKFPQKAQSAKNALLWLESMRAKFALEAEEEEKDNYRKTHYPIPAANLGFLESLQAFHRSAETARAKKAAKSAKSELSAQSEQEELLAGEQDAQDASEFNEAQGLQGEILTPRKALIQREGHVQRILLNQGNPSAPAPNHQDSEDSEGRAQTEESDLN